MNKEASNSLNNYIDMVRNHKEKAFDEGMEALLSVIKESSKNGTGDFGLPENPYKIKEKKGENNGHI